MTIQFPGLPVGLPRAGIQQELPIPASSPQNEEIENVWQAQSTQDISGIEGPSCHLISCKQRMLPPGNKFCWHTQGLVSDYYFTDELKNFYCVFFCFVPTLFPP